MHTHIPNHPMPTIQPARLNRSEVTLLLVDDDAIVLELLQAVLTTAGYKVLAAPDGHSAIELSRRSSFDMLVTDFNMPGMDGYELAIKLTEHLPVLPVLVVSASDIVDLPSEELAQRRWNFLPKPVNSARMLQIVDGECLGWTIPARGAECRDCPAQFH